MLGATGHADSDQRGLGDCAEVPHVDPAEFLDVRLHKLEERILATLTSRAFEFWNDASNHGHAVALNDFSNSAAASINRSNIGVSPKNIGPSISR